MPGISLYFMQNQKEVAIVGSGLVGSLLAIFLRKQGHKVTIFDRRPDVRLVEFSGRSINLAMSNRGWKALREAGIEDEIRKLALPLDKRAMHVDDKPVYFQKYGEDGEAIYSISRGILNRKMIDLAEEAGAEFRFEEKIWDVDLPNAKLYTGESEKASGKNISSILFLEQMARFQELVTRCRDRAGSIIPNILLM